ncbi:MotA/TolQ/ExbB proton channel family protein [Alkalicaulis satelles]|uniref:MotA/TolQ/ExbB proton channel family protein n=1 Tax=Alkalicaulis satelles TaxID=2609175 RepID=A0A5M6ZB39_9PROT|nr:MotA/TolQ/ExbB proton channel family protein [Alkalicaulis satelles]KAA5800987.1 MotA/TolQ/ExbB proton channel family protein [Alkalicaulis satelles]
MKHLISMIAAVSIGAGALAAPALAAQQDREPVRSIQELLDRVRADSRDAAAENQRRLQEFRQRRDEQAALLRQAQGTLSSLRSEAERLREEFESNQRVIAELDAELRAAQGEYGELFGAARQAAGEVAALIEGSLISHQYPRRHEPLRTLAETRTLPDRRDLDQIWRAQITEMEAQGQVVTYSARIVGQNDGEPLDVTRVGPFVAMADRGGAKFVQWSVDSSNRAAGYRMTELSRQPPGRLVSAANTLINAEAGRIVAGPVDPSRGSLLRVYLEVPNLQERFNQGGLVAQIILALLVFSSAFGIFRLFVLMGVNSAINAQKRRSTASSSNPLGRIMLAYEEVKDKPINTIELKIDEAILRETPKLEFGLNFLKLAAAVAPLLGLLGTVTGMIRTFTQITLFGTGDPQIMAGGISEALVTTVMGLISAIPLLFIHSFAASFARGAQSTLEEQAAGIIARHAEEKSAG